MTPLQYAAREAIALMDLTTLNEDDTDEKVALYLLHVKPSMHRERSIYRLPRS